MISVKSFLTSKAVACAASVMLVLAGAAPQAWSDPQIDYQSFFNQIQNSSGSPLALGSVVRIGTFPAGFDFAGNSGSFTATNAAFEPYGSAVIGAGGAPAGQFAASVLTPGTNTGERIYLWFFNSADPTTATEWAIVTNPTANWLVPPDVAPPANLTTIDSGQPGTNVPTGARGMLSAAPGTTGGGFDILTTPVPEPGTWVLMGLGVVGLVAFRARKRRGAILG